MINKLQLQGLNEQPKQRDAYPFELSQVQSNWDALKQTLSKNERKQLLRIIDAKDMIGEYVAQDCYINGFCTALKLVVDNICKQE